MKARTLRALRELGRTVERVAAAATREGADFGEEPGEALGGWRVGGTRVSLGRRPPPRGVSRG
jgi:hypothetical protein